MPPVSTPTTPTLRPYQDAADTARDRAQAAADQVIQLQKDLKAIEGAGQVLAGGIQGYGATENPTYKRKAAELEQAFRLYDSAAREHQKALDALADATTKEAQRADPTTRQTLQAAADRARAEADQAKAAHDEYIRATPDRRSQVISATRLARAQADQADLETAFQRETDPVRKAALEEQLKQARSKTSQAQADADVASQTVGARVTTAQETANQAGIQTHTTQANLDILLRQIRQAPTDEQARQALETALRQGSANVTQTEATTAGTRANTAQTEAQTAVTRLGGLANLNEYLATQKDLIARGVLSPDEADQALRARIAGTDIYTATQAAEKATMDRFNSAITQRGQDTSLVSGARGNLTSAGTSAFGTISGAASRAPHGSGAALAGGYNAMLNDLTNRFGGPTAFQTPAQVAPPALPPMLQRYAANPPDAAGPVTTAGSGAGQVTINIGGAGPAASPASSPPTLEPSPFEARNAGNEVFSGRPPTFIRNKMPATPQDVISMYPEAARRAGVQYG